jgi:ABC-type polar amino acid transport system ATPase subunit
MLKVSHLKTKNVLKGISFEVESGQVAIFLGRSGVGKSTLLRVLNHLEPDESGIVTLDEAPLNLSQVNQSHTMGLVFQHFNLFDHLTVEENVTLALTLLHGQTKEEAKQLTTPLLSRFGLSEKAETFPPKLSGGQKQRLALARTLALNPQILCLDEPTSALDPILTQQIAQTIQELASEQRIILLATHDMHLVRLLKGKLFLMEGGEIVETALMQQYEKDPGQYPLLGQFFNP